MPRADLTIRLTADKINASLRADDIQRDAILAIAQALHDDPRNHLLDALRDLGRIASASPNDGELDDLLGDIETLADTGPAAVELNRAELEQLAAESRLCLNDLTRPKAVQQNRREAA